MRLCLFLLTLFAFFPSYASMKGIYGQDNRKEMYQIDDPRIRELMRSTAVQIRRDNFSFIDQQMTISYDQTVGAENSLCLDQLFVDQINPGECSGFLIAPDLLVTAGHCVRDESECRQYRWLFDFSYESPDKNVSLINPNSLHSCAEIVAQEFQSGKQDDYAVIRLSPPVTDRRPLSFRRDGEISIGESVFVIGYPLGIPAKFADGAVVQKNGSRYYFTTNLDTFVVNSGSAVFNANTLELEGILVRGGRDLKFDSIGQCNRYYQNQEDLGEEEVMRITRLPLHDL